MGGGSGKANEKTKGVTTVGRKGNNTGIRQ